MDKLLAQKSRIIGFLILSTLLLAWPVILTAASAGKVNDISWAQLMIQLLGGLGIFLYGMEQMSESMKIVAGDRMRTILAKLSNTRIMGLLTGALVTMVIQSSSVTTVMLVGFVSAGLMSFSQSIAVILGADIGTTITAQIVAFKVTKYALVLVAGGVGMQFFSKNDKVIQYGLMIMGLGLVFYGMGVMSAGMKPLRSYQPFLDLMASMDNPVFGILVAAAFTGLVQSSSATTGVVIVLGIEGVINLEAGIALILGANIGTCVTAGLASIGKPREAVRVALAHISFKILGVLIILPFIPFLAKLAVNISPENDLPRQIANSHTMFNVGLAMIFLPFTTQFARIINWIAPDHKETEIEEELLEIRYMDEVLLDTPALALQASRHEMQRMGHRLQKMLRGIVPGIYEGQPEDLDEIERLDEEVDIIHRHVLAYLSELSERGMASEETLMMINLMSTVNDLEHIGDLVDTDLIPLGRRRIEQKLEVTPAIFDNLQTLGEVVADALEMTLEALEDLDEHKALTAAGQKEKINQAVSVAESMQAVLLAGETKNLDAYSVQMNVIDKLKRVYYHTKRIARTVADTAEISEAA
ncbi:MAG: Na/Pi cotransporter family protein [SAR324 cluster bacterium]|nr:Na/Pi cotransporter family protein [SAR324 cluster bacterium]